MNMRLEKLIRKSAGLILFVIIALYAASYMATDVPSYEVDKLDGVYWLLFYAAKFHIVVFPLASIIVTIFSGHNISDIFTINMCLTLPFSIFAWVINFHALPWTFILIANTLIWGAMVVDNRIKKNKHED